MIEAILTWAGLLQESDLLNQNLLKRVGISDLILIGYAVAMVVNKKVVFITAFFMSEVVGLMLPLSLSERYLFIMYAGIDGALYWHLVSRKAKKDTIYCCGIMVILDIGMAIDAQINQAIETFMHFNYGYMCLFIHVCLILSLVNRGSAVGCLVNAYRAITRIARNSNAMSFFNISVFKVKEKERKK